MNKTLLAVFTIVGIFVFSSVMVLGYGMSTYNRAKTLNVSYDAKYTANEASFDNMWKIIQQTASVTDAQKEALKEVLIGYAEARSAGQDSGGSLMRWVQESVPNVDTTTFNNLQNIIAGTRDTWTFNQLELVDIAREYNTMIETQPSGFVLSLFGMERIDPTVITSSRTDEAFATGRDDNVAVFN